MHTESSRFNSGLGRLRIGRPLFFIFFLPFLRFVFHPASLLNPTYIIRLLNICRLFIWTHHNSFTYYHPPSSVNSRVPSVNITLAGHTQSSWRHPPGKASPPTLRLLSLFPFPDSSAPLLPNVPRLPGVRRFSRSRESRPVPKEGRNAQWTLCPAAYLSLRQHPFHPIIFPSPPSSFDPPQSWRSCLCHPI